MTLIPGTSLHDNSEEMSAKMEPFLKSQSFAKLFSREPGQFVALNMISADFHRLDNRLYLHDASATNRRFIVKLRDGLDDRAVKLLKQVMGAMDGSVKHSLGQVYKGLVVGFPEGKLPLSLLKSMDAIEWIEQDGTVQACERQSKAPWGLARISHASSSYPKNYDFDKTGKGVTAYLIDSGVSVKHPELAGRAKIGFSVIDSGDDCAGHGTEVASALAGTNCGVAKQCNIVVAQVLDCDGSGANADLVAALDWIVQNHQKPAVINMSVGGPRSRSIDLAVQRAIRRGISVIVAAGNSSTNACELSPSGAPGVICVGATNEFDERASFSNYGSCVSIFAPGTNIPIATTRANQIKNGFGFVSGTSIATPIVAGIVALILEKDPEASPQSIMAQLRKLALQGKLKSITLKGSPNLLAQAPLMSTASTGVQLMPAGSLPVHGAGMKYGELAIIIVCGVLAGIFLGLLLFIAIRQIRRRRAANRIAAESLGVPSPIQIIVDPSRAPGKYGYKPR